MKKILLIILTCFILTGCGTTQYLMVKNPISVPVPPRALAVDDGKIEKDKFPNTTWIKKPEIIKNQQKAAWSFEDIDKINKSCMEWSDWAKNVDEIIATYNRSAEESGSLTKPKKAWYRFW